MEISNYNNFLTGPKSDGKIITFNTNHIISVTWTFAEYNEVDGDTTKTIHEVYECELEMVGRNNYKINVNNIEFVQKIYECLTNKSAKEEISSQTTPAADTGTNTNGNPPQFSGVIS